MIGSICSALQKIESSRMLRATCSEDLVHALNDALGPRGLDVNFSVDFFINLEQTRLVHGKHIYGQQLQNLTYVWRVRFSIVCVIFIKF